jgi:hypothetical protein
MPNSPISVSGLNRNNKRVQVNKKRISNIEQGMSNDEVFLFSHPFPIEFSQGFSTHTDISPDDLSGEYMLPAFAGNEK